MSRRERVKRIIGQYFRKKALPADFSKSKHNPNSLSETLRLIGRRAHTQNGENGRNSASQFEPIIRPYFELILDRYRGVSEKVHGNLTQHIEKLEGNKSSILYYDLRVYAAYLGVPSAALLIYSHVLGDVAKGKTPEEISALLEALTAGIDALRQHLLPVGEIISQSTLREAMVIDRISGNGDNTYNAKIEPLEAMATAIRQIWLDPMDQTVPNARA